MDAIKLARMVEVVGRGDAEREGGREFYAPPVSEPHFIIRCAGTDARC